MNKPPIWQRDEPDSPCVQICMIDLHSKLCIGCYRTADEIAAWARMDAPSRQSLRAELPKRAAQIKPNRRGGRTRRR